MELDTQSYLYNNALIKLSGVGSVRSVNGCDSCEPVYFIPILFTPKTGVNCRLPGHRSPHIVNTVEIYRTIYYLQQTDEG